MKNIILPFFDSRDLAQLPTVLENLHVLNPERVLAIVNPSIGVSSDQVSAKFEARIAEIRAAMKSAVEREDYAAAQGHKSELEGVQVERDLALREGYKHMNPEELKASWQKALAPLGDVMIIGLTEVFQKDNFPNALQSIQRYWPEDMPHGEYSIVWPLSVEKVKIRPQVTEAVIEEPVVASTDPKEREMQLRGMDGRHTLKLARELGVFVNGMKASDAITAILNKEFGAAA